MSLKVQVEKAILTAMKSKDATALRGLREIKAQLLLAQTSGNGEVDEAAELKILQKMAKQRQDSIAIYEEQGREDLAVKEREELVTISAYLPAQMSLEELADIVKNAINTSGAEGMKDMGKVMPLVKDAVKGAADGKAISEIIKKLLS